MNPDDDRHGTSAGYNAGCRDLCCWRAKQRYDKQRRWELHTTGNYRTTSSRGAVRRLQALQTLGWSIPKIAQRAGLHVQQVYAIEAREVVYTSTHERIAEIYDQLSMTLPPEQTRGDRVSVVRARNRAKRNGWAPPLAYDDIDNDTEPNLGGCDAEVDPVIVMRLLQGEQVTSTKDEKNAAMERWIADGGSRAELCRWHGWQEGRYGRPTLRLVEESA